MPQVLGRNLSAKDQVETISSVSRFLSEKEMRPSKCVGGGELISEHIQEGVDFSPQKSSWYIFLKENEEPGRVAHTWDPSTWEVETRGLGI